MISSIGVKNPLIFYKGPHCKCRCDMYHISIYSYSMTVKQPPNNFTLIFNIKFIHSQIIPVCDVWIDPFMKIHSFRKMYKLWCKKNYRVYISKSVSINHCPARPVFICLFFKNINIFCQLKLEIALAIPASNEWKIDANNSAGEGLIFLMLLMLLHNLCRLHLLLLLDQKN